MEEKQKPKGVLSSQSGLRSGHRRDKGDNKSIVAGCGFYVGSLMTGKAGFGHGKLNTAGRIKEGKTFDPPRNLLGGSGGGTKTRPSLPGKEQIAAAARR